MDDKIRGYINLGSGWRRPAEEFDSYAEAFHRAAQRLTHDFLENPAHHPLDACPIIFLYRHATELYLKGVLRVGERLLGMTGQQPGFTASSFMNHDLHLLLPPLADIFRTMNWDESHKEITDFVKRLNRLDPRSFTFRYPVDKKDDAALPKHFVFDLRSFTQEADSCLKVLYNASHSILEAMEHMEE